MAGISFRSIAPGIEVVRGGLCNRGIIHDGGRTLLVDTGLGPAEALPVRERAASYPGQAQLMVFNTHSHGDHVYGNQAFADCPIIAHAGVRDEMVMRGAETLARWRERPGMADALSKVQLTLPTLTFDDSVIVYAGDIEVQLTARGRAHSHSDSIAWLPASRTLFAGDLLFNAIVPAIPAGGNLEAWIAVLADLEALEPMRVVPGHGPVQPPKALADLRRWLMVLREQLGEAIACRHERTAAVEHVAAAMQRIAPRAMSDRLHMVVGQAYDQLTPPAAWQ